MVLLSTTMSLRWGRLPHDEYNKLNTLHKFIVNIAVHYIFSLIVEYLPNISFQDTLQYVTIHYNTLQYVTIRYNTLQYVTIRYNTLQYIILYILCYCHLSFQA